MDLSFTILRSMDNDGVQFRCSCHGGTQFIVYTKANIPYASCPVCGSVCEPMVQTSITVPMGQMRIANSIPAY